MSSGFDRFRISFVNDADYRSYKHLLEDLKEVYASPKQQPLYSRISG